MVKKIGFNAGKVWTVLDESGRLSLKDLRKQTKLTEKEIYAALGWLAREDKVEIEEVEKDVFVQLV